MRQVLFLVFLLLLFVPTCLFAQAVPDDPIVELVVLTRPPLIVGAQVEFAGVDHVAPWASVRYGEHDMACSFDCTGEFAALAGARFHAGPWASVEPYVTLGIGQLQRRGRGPDVTGTAHLGAVWLGFGRLRPRIEFGYEAHINPWMNVGLGYLP